MVRGKAYHKAVKKIEEAQRLGGTDLDLSNMGITKLPPEIFELKNLKTLKLGFQYPGNQNLLTKLPDEIEQLGQLQLLDLSNNILSVLPESLGHLSHLRSLNLSANDLGTLPESIGQLTQLQDLDLSHNKLIKLPGSLVSLTELQNLNLSNNSLTLFESLGGFTRLQSLDLSVNRLTDMPESLAQLTQLQSLDLSYNDLMVLPESLEQLTQLRSLRLSLNRLTLLPDWIGNFTQLQLLSLYYNELTGLPKSLGKLTQLQHLDISSNAIVELPDEMSSLVALQVLDLTCIGLTTLPDWIGSLTRLEALLLDNRSQQTQFFRRRSPGYKEYANAFTDISYTIVQLKHLKTLNLDDNPLNPELATAYEQGLDAVKAYLRAKAAAQITLNEAKLILVGEGEVGKSCLMDALQGIAWQEHDTTHGIEIKQIQTTDPGSKKEITLNGWDFGGQRVYRPTHQLFFSAPAVYLVVWKPREGPQQGFVKEWIRLVKHREPDAKILVVATHGGPQQRQPDIDRQELWDLFGKDTVIDFFFVDSKPDANGNRRGIDELKQAIARVAVTLPEMGRSVPKRWQEVRESLQKNGAAYLPFADVLAICRRRQMDDAEARLFITIEHRLGHLIHYENDPALHDIVILKPNWLSNAMSFVLDDEETRDNHGLVRFSRLSRLWNDPHRADESRYPIDLHPIFLRLMERFDLSYRVAGLRDSSNETSLIAQLVPDNRPDPVRGWVDYPPDGNGEQMQICRIIDEKGQSATAEGLFYQLIVRLHKYSLGRVNYYDSVHWQRGLVLDDDYNGRALLEYKGNDVHITVRAPYPERFLAMLTSEVKYLVENFWQGLRCQIMVPCVNPCGKNEPGTGLYQVDKLIDSKRKSRPDFPCPVCNEWQNIDALLRNAPAATRSISLDELLAQFPSIKDKLDSVDTNTRRILSQVDDAYSGMIRVLTEAKEGPRLFDLVPVERSKFNPREWTRAKFRLTLWCEHSRLPLNSPYLNGKDSTKGVYEIEMERAEFKKFAPYFKVLYGTLSLVLPMAVSAAKIVDDQFYKDRGEMLTLGKATVDALIGEGTKLGDWMGSADSTRLRPDETRPEFEASRAEGAILRELHAMLSQRPRIRRAGARDEQTPRVFVGASEVCGRILAKNAPE